MVTFFTDKYFGTLFVAAVMDANRCVFLIAFGIGLSEIEEAWGWQSLSPTKFVNHKYKMFKPIIK